MTISTTNRRKLSGSRACEPRRFHGIFGPLDRAREMFLTRFGVPNEVRIAHVKTPEGGWLHLEVRKELPDRRYEVWVCHRSDNVGLTLHRQ
ncbi:hypothetical protein [Cypionkella sp.]|uniref:hypothetical protein n=1 Tax=Cypionkella sp. TaxID=2811411 RepID=UPI002718E9F9|nr:hypothetical protein [Cypionkella sp.]MDO8986070.1 hypothetical protein [Cypionkella sp.]